MKNERKLELFDNAISWIWEHTEKQGILAYLTALKQIGYTKKDVFDELTNCNFDEDLFENIDINEIFNEEENIESQKETEKTFLDIKIGDKVIVHDEYSHDYIEHILEVTSIEYDKEYITDTNPKGMHCFGTDLQEDEWGDDYITQIHEGNFCRVLKEREKMRVCDHCLAAIESREGKQATLTHYIDCDDLAGSYCDWCERAGFDTLYELI